jgi:hypothetical protein
MDKLDVVYILRNSGSRWMNNEIKYSIRSIEKNLDFRNIWIVGKLPKFIDEKIVGNIMAEDPFNNKLLNAIHKISLACRNEDVSEDFILMNDDFFFLQKEEIKFYRRGTIKSSKRTHSTKGGYYYKAICKTLEFLQGMGINNPIDFEIHYPIIINKKKFLQSMEKVKNEGGILFRSVYGNLNKIETEYRKDVKIYTPGQFEKMKKLPMISTDERIATDIVFQKWINSKFKNESRFEKKPISAFVCSNIFSYKGKQYNPGDMILEEIPETIVKANDLKKIQRVFYK